jgi:hypothetical protein
MDVTNIKINPDALTIGDIALFMGADAGTDASAMMPKIIDMLERVVVGGVRHLPATSLSDVLAEVMRQWSEVANPKAAAA